MEVYRSLRKNRDVLLQQYFANLEDVYDLQDTLLQSILPSITDELGLGLQAQAWAKEWLSDTSSIFRISRRNNFTRSFCLEAAQKDLQWRLENLWPLKTAHSIPNLQCLPVHARDPFGRPIIVLKADPIVGDVLSEKQNILVHTFENMRLHLKQLYDDSEDDNPTLQYVVLLDLNNLSLQSFDLDLFAWTAREVASRFPGMIGAVFMLNYSWAHSGLWGVLKRLLPEAAHSRIFFLSNKELIECLTPSALPREFGGSLPPLVDLEDPLRPISPPLDERPAHLEFPPLIATDKPRKSSSWLSSTSALNPFFGYPVALRPGLPALRYGRRRKRDLLRTLAKLFWLRWHKQMTTVLCLISLVVLFRSASKKGLLGLFGFPRRVPLAG